MTLTYQHSLQQLTSQSLLINYHKKATLNKKMLRGILSLYPYISL